MKSTRVALVRFDTFLFVSTCGQVALNCGIHLEAEVHITGLSVKWKVGHIQAACRAEIRPETNNFLGECFRRKSKFVDFYRSFFSFTFQNQNIADQRVFVS